MPADGSPLDAFPASARAPDAALHQHEMLAAFAELAILSEDIDRLLQEACDYVRRAVGADIVLLYRQTPDGRSVEVRAGAGIAPTLIGARLTRRNDQSLESRLLRDGEPVIVPDARDEPRLETRGLLRSFEQRGLALIPLRDGPGTPMLGLLHISTRESRDFSAEFAFLRIYASLVAASMLRIEALRRRQDERAARERSEWQLRLVLEGIPQLVWCAEPGAQWRWMGPQWTEVTGRDPDSSLGRGWLEAVHPDDAAAVEQAWGSAEARGIFEVECRIWHQHDGRYRWYQGRALPTASTLGDQTWVGTFTDVEDLRALEARQAVLVAELQHRTRNLLAVVEGIAVQTMAATESLDAFAASFHDRLQALARAQQLLAGASGEAITIRQLLETERDALGMARGDALIALNGPDVLLPSTMVQTLALVIHELGTNSRKYGVIARGEGRIAIDWRVSGSGAGRALDLDWVETGDFAAPAAGQRRGFGRELIERALPFQLGASSDYSITAGAVRCRLHVPLDAAT
ncbi:HWE histidine kinase domain-containing protein [Sphingomonas sp. BK235]|uniref:sensor histidine kinase n=1 Tax=Sphingomonas sp. BK235 TaxID=2512131 RepID=UPI00104B22EA|nr:HWE histidine kinase domain-containing protein [Sphingomonas sp. BK235]TCP34170.1 PAS domain S-box-containing protein [Sphingomonas sp. BK235]